jgi:hypothetical protein
LGSTTQKKEIGVILSNNLKDYAHFKAITARCNYILGQLLNSFLGKETIYCSFVDHICNLPRQCGIHILKNT